MSNKKFRSKNYAVTEFNIHAGEKVLSTHKFRFGFRQCHDIQIKEDAKGNKFAKLPVSLLDEIEKFGKKQPNYKNDKTVMVKIAQEYDKKVRDFVDNIMISVYGSKDGNNINTTNTTEDTIDNIQPTSSEDSYLSKLEDAAVITEAIAI